MIMGIRIYINTVRLEQILNRTVARKVAEEKVRQLERASQVNFRDDTGELRDTIRLEGDNTVAIGDRDHDYWQNVRSFRRGDGRLWVRGVLHSGNAAALQRAQNALGR